LSRICKSALAKKYINLCRVTNNQSTFMENQSNVSYDSLKNTNTNYITAKQTLMQAFKSSNYGTWVEKPEELTTFKLNVN